MAAIQPLRFKGAPGSPYTRKMLAVLRYRHLPYEFLIGDQATDLGLPEPKVALLPTFYLPDASGQIQAVVDSTPLIRRFETEYPGRSVIPADPVLGFLDYLLEDYADEWLTKAMFHYRWYYQADIDKAGTILPMWRGISEAPDKLRAAAKFVAERQISRLYVVGSNDVTAPVIEDSYRRFLSIFDALLQRHPFLFGQRPASADFAIYAQLTQLAKFDPTPTDICLKEAPRINAWTDLVDDLSGTPAADDGWADRSAAGTDLRDLLSEVGRVYAPALLANAAALMAGEPQMHTTIDGRPWQQPTFPYQGKCLQWIREAFAALTEKDRAAVRDLLDGTGCEPLLETPT
ncbi:MAG: glutathione S-transferase N-terminal domain-containing protein [Pseudomonadales bacterium]